MTNDVREIKNRYFQQTERELMRVILKNSAATSDVLFDALFDDLYDLYKSGHGLYKQTIAVYKLIYEKAGIEFPEVFENIKSNSDFAKLILIKKDDSPQE